MLTVTHYRLSRLLPKDRFCWQCWFQTGLYLNTRVSQHAVRSCDAWCPSLCTALQSSGDNEWCNNSRVGRKRKAHPMGILLLLPVMDRICFICSQFIVHFLHDNYVWLGSKEGGSCWSGRGRSNPPVKEGSSLWRGRKRRVTTCPWRHWKTPEETRGEWHYQASEMTMSTGCRRLAELRKSPKTAGPRKTGGKDLSARQSEQRDVSIHALLFKSLSNGVVPSLCSNKQT